VTRQSSCFNCGAEVEADQWDEDCYGRRTFICDQRECHREFRYSQEAEYERALADFNDQWGRR